MKYLWTILGSATILVGCGSTVKLDDVAVEDKSGSSVAQSASSGAATQQASGIAAVAVAKTTVVPVDLGKTNAADANAANGRIVYFDYDSYIIRPEFQSILENQARLIKADKNRKVSLEGHTDDSGGREYNLALGQKRAESVRNALGLLGVAESQMEAVSFGKEKPASQGSDDTAMSKNRRVEITYR